MVRGHILASCLAAGLLLPAPLEAQWAPGGIPVCGVNCSASDLPLLLGDGTGGIYVLWRKAQSGQDDVYLQRVAADGIIAQGWPAAGLALATTADSERPQGLVSDGIGGVVALWDQVAPSPAGVDLYAQRVHSDGTLAPKWPVGGVPVSRAPGNQVSGVIVADGAGGAHLAWEDARDEFTTSRDIYAQHILADGTIAPGWIEDGLPVCTIEAFAGAPKLLVDGAGGSVVAWVDARRGVVDIFGQHLLADGMIAPGWVTNGRLLVPDRLRPRIAPDGAGGFYLASAVPHALTNGDKDFFLHRFSIDGTPAPGWPAGGVLVCEGAADPNLFDDRYDLQVEPDGFGGVLLSWYDYRSGGSDIYVARVQADGTRAPGWTENGVQVSGTGAFVGGDFDARLAADGAGGAYVSWEWQTGVSRALVQHLTPGGAVAPGWVPGGIEVRPGVSGQFKPEVASDGAGGAIVVWRESAIGGRGGLWAQRFVVDGPVPVQLALTSSEATPNRVTLLWQGPGAGLLKARTERRSGVTEWVSLGDAIPEGADRLSFEDHSVVAGERYAYRLVYRDEGTERASAETWIDVPEALALALEGFHPNPAIGAATVAFTLPDARSARLEVLDIGGRRVLVREVGALGPGRHALPLNGGRRLAPGVYLLRLTSADQAVLTRGVVMR